MNRKSIVAIVGQGFWGRVLGVSMVLFFVYLGDAILSDWVPSFIQDSTHSSFAMGLIISFSSIVGFTADLIFPQLLKLVKTRKLMLMAIGTSLIFSGILLWTIVLPWLLLFIFAMAAWGIYYEFLGFGRQQFMIESVPGHSRSAAWAIMSVFRSLAYFLGPILGSYIALTKGNSETVLAAVFFVLIGYFLWLVVGKNSKKTVLEGTGERIDILKEIRLWWILLEHVWPVLTISIVMGLVDATYWTTGTVFSDRLAGENWLGGMFLPFYTLPMVLFGVVMARWGVYKGKKRLAEIFMLVAGILLACMGLVNSIYLMLLVSFLTGTAMSFAWPLTDAVYSDIVFRMGKEGKHMVGLSGSTISLAYIIGPILAGGIAQIVGEQATFSILGILMTILAVYLLMVTPKKLRLPQEVIKTWD